MIRIVKTLLCRTAAVVLVCGVSATASAAGNIIEFSIDNGASSQQQAALVQNGMISVKQVGGDVGRDMLYEKASNTLYIIDHRQRSYMKIDQGVIDQVASMVDSLSAVVESQQGVLADLLGTLGLGTADEESVVSMKNTGTMLQVSGVRCSLFQAYRDDQLETEVCIAAPESLGALGDNYDTLEAFYAFSEQLLNRASQILSSLGVVIPTLKMESDEGLPVLVHQVKERIKSRLDQISNESLESERFLLPNGYTESAIPFIS